MHALCPHLFGPISLACLLIQASLWAVIPCVNEAPLVSGAGALPLDPITVVQSWWITGRVLLTQQSLRWTWWTWIPHEVSINRMVIRALTVEFCVNKYVVPFWMLDPNPRQVLEDPIATQSRQIVSNRIILGVSKYQTFGWLVKWFHFLFKKKKKK